MKTYFTIILTLISLIGPMKAASITGTVIDEETNLPIEAATLFIPNTSISTQTDSQGYYTLIYAQSGFNELVIKHISYQPRVLNLATEPTNHITLQKKIRQITEVNISVVDPNRKHNLFQFWYNFIGLSKVALSCQLVNPETLNFRRLGYPGDPAYNTIVATADSSLIIDNKTLGYQIQYTLMKYVHSSQMISFQGYPLFVDLYKSKKLPSKIAKERAKAYKGSNMHFFRSLYANNLETEGFGLYEIKLVANLPEDERFLGLLGDTLLTHQAGYHYEQTSIPLDLKNKLDFTSGKGRLTSLLPFEVRYLNDSEERRYRSQFVYYQRIGLIRTAMQQTSILVLPNDTLEFYPDGYYSNPEDVIFLGYWDFKRMGDMLPLDYVPTE